MYMMNAFSSDSRHVTYVEHNHYYKTHTYPTSSYTPTQKVTDVQPKKEGFFSKVPNSFKSPTKSSSPSFKATKSGFSSSGSSYKSASSFKSSSSGFSSSRSGFSSSGFRVGRR
jgi:hypothetical protein